MYVVPNPPPPSILLTATHINIYTSRYLYTRDARLSSECWRWNYVFDNCLRCHPLNGKVVVVLVVVVEPPRGARSSVIAHSSSLRFRLNLYPPQPPPLQNRFHLRERHPSAHSDRTWSTLEI